MSNQTSSSQLVADKSIFYRGEPSYILTYAGNDNFNRGDVQGLIGIGQIMAQKSGRPFFYLDDQTITERYPDLPTLEDRYKAFIKDHGRPDVSLFSVNINPNPHLRAPTEIREKNEHLAMKVQELQHKKLVPNSITDKRLTDEKEHFEAKHHGAHSNIIAVMHVTTNGKTDEFAKKLVTMLAASENPEATIYLCGTRRTDALEHKELYDAIKRELIAQRLDNMACLENFFMSEAFNSHADYNPYMGLLAKAQHFVVCGESTSLLSEPLSRGRSVMNFGPRQYYLERDGFVHDFASIDPQKGLPTRDTPPMNVTEMVADYYLERFRQSGAKMPEPAAPVLG